MPFHRLQSEKSALGDFLVRETLAEEKHDFDLSGTEEQGAAFVWGRTTRTPTDRECREYPLGVELAHAFARRFPEQSVHHMPAINEALNESFRLSHGKQLAGDSKGFLCVPHRIQGKGFDHQGFDCGTYGSPSSGVRKEKPRSGKCLFGPRPGEEQSRKSKCLGFESIAVPGMAFALRASRTQR
jgi:hypothetical protein